MKIHFLRLFYLFLFGFFTIVSVLIIAITPYLIIFISFHFLANFIIDLHGLSHRDYFFCIFIIVILSTIIYLPLPCMMHDSEFGKGKIIKILESILQNILEYGEKK